MGILVDGSILTILPEGQRVDEEVSSPVFYAAENARFFRIKVYQGDWETNEDLTTMGSFHVTIPHPGPSNSNPIVLKFTYCSDCIVRIKAYINDKLEQTAELIDRWCNADLDILKQKYKDLQQVLDENILFENKQIEIQNRALKLIEAIQGTKSSEEDAETVLMIKINARRPNTTTGILNSLEETLRTLEEKYRNCLYLCLRKLENYLSDDGMNN